jgi:hypothetical protein
MLVGTQALNGDARKAVVVEGHASIAFVCWAPCRIEHLVIRTRVAAAGCSAVTVRRRSHPFPLRSVYSCRCRLSVPTKAERAA